MFLAKSNQLGLKSNVANAGLLVSGGKINDQMRSYSGGSNNGSGPSDNNGTGKSIGRGRRRKSKFVDKYFDSNSWIIDEDPISPFTKLTSASVGNSKGSQGKSSGYDTIYTGQFSDKQSAKDKYLLTSSSKDAGIFGMAGSDRKLGSKSIELWQYLHSKQQNFQQNVGQKLGNAPSSFNQQFQQSQQTRKLDAASLRDAITLQEHTEILETMLNDTNPRSMRSHLDDYIIGQDKAKEALSCAVYNHYSRVLHNLKMRQEALETFPSKQQSNLLDKSNILILGPSGSGKTLMAKRIAEILQVPFCMNDATTFTQAGYVGDDVEQCIARLLQTSGSDVRKSEIGIVFIDEIDKISKRDVSGSSTSRDVAGEGVQQSLLKMLEGTVVHVSEKGKKNKDETIAVDTSNILFILSGAFVGINKIADNRMQVRRSLGFGGSSASDAKADKPVVVGGAVNEADLISFGLIPEFVGRIPLLVSVDKLTEDELVRILSEPKNSLVHQYSSLFESWNVKLEFTDASLHSIAKRVMDRQTGARGLKFVMEEILKQAMYYAPGSEVKKVTINEDLKAEFVTDSSVFIVDNSSGVRKPLQNNETVEGHDIIAPFVGGSQSVMPLGSPYLHLKPEKK